MSEKDRFSFIPNAVRIVVNTLNRDPKTQQQALEELVQFQTFKAPHLRVNADAFNNHDFCITGDPYDPALQDDLIGDLPNAVKPKQPPPAYTGHWTDYTS